MPILYQPRIRRIITHRRHCMALFQDLRRELARQSGVKCDNEGPGIGAIILRCIPYVPQSLGGLPSVL
jgi:hypothetical protein